MAKAIEENEKLITSLDVSDIEQVFTLAIKGCGTNRESLKQILSYEDVLKAKMEMTLKVIKDKSKSK